MPLRLLAIALLLAVPLRRRGLRHPRTLTRRQPDFSMVVQGTFDAETLAEFNRRVQDYAALRKRLEVGLPPLVVTTDADEIETFEHRLAERIRRRARVAARADIRRRDGRAGEAHDASLARMQATIAAIMDDGPGEFDIDVNDTYNKKHALATMPPNLLLLLPDLPKDLEYRFVGRHLDSPRRARQHHRR